MTVYLAVSCVPSMGTSRFYVAVVNVPIISRLFFPCLFFLCGPHNRVACFLHTF